MDLQTIKQNLLDAIFADPNKVFNGAPFAPLEWNDRYKGGTWYSRNHINGARSKSGRGAYIADGRNDKHAYIADENGSETIEILKYWEETKGERFPNCPDLFSLYGIEPPTYDREQQQRAAERKTATDSLLADIRADYLGNAGAAVRGYLSAPIAEGGRGYDAATVERMADYIGVITAATAKRLSAVSGLPIPDNVADRWPLVILTKSKRDGTIQYAKFRTIAPNATGSDKWHNPTKGNTGTGRDDVDPYNYNNTSFLSATGSRTVVVVESELCAAHATAKGIKNVIALRGSDGIKPALARRLMREHCQRVVILYDTETTAEGRAKTAKKIQATIDKLRNAAATLQINVATIPTEYNAKDPDELLATHPQDGSTILQDIIDNAPAAYRWTAAQAATQYTAAANDTEREQIERDIVKRTAEMVNIGGQSAIDADKLSAEFCHLSGATIDPDTMSRVVVDTARQQATEQYGQKRDRLFNELDEARKAGDERAMRRAMADIMDAQPPQDDPELNQQGATFDKVFADLYRDAARDITTNYGLYTKQHDKIERQPVKLYANGITYFAGGTSHGKSTVLQNIAYDLLRQGKRVLYYGFEEVKRDTLLEFVNIAIHQRLTDVLELSKDGSTEAINNYFKERDAAVFNGRKWKGGAYEEMDDTDRQTTRDAILNFFHNYRGTDNGGDPLLYIYDDAFTSAELIDHISGVWPVIRPDAIFIDYVQFMTGEGDSKPLAQWEELGRVSKDLIRINKTYNIPVVVAAQLLEKNNEKSPDGLRYTDIFGASAIAQGAAAVYLIANGYKYANSVTVDYFGNSGANGEPFGQRGKIYIKLDKNRFGACPAFGLYTYDGARRYIDPDSLLEPTAAEPQPPVAKMNDDKDTPF